MRQKRFIALAVIAATLALTAVPGRSDARGKPIHLNLGVDKAVSKSVGSAVAIGLGVAVGVLAIVGGVVWHYIRHRKDSPTAAAGPPAGTETASQG